MVPVKISLPILCFSFVYSFLLFQIFYLLSFYSRLFPAFSTPPFIHLSVIPFSLFSSFVSSIHPSSFFFYACFFSFMSPLCLPSRTYSSFRPSLCHSFLRSTHSFFPSIRPSSFSSTLPLFLLSVPFSSSSAFRPLHTHLQFIVLHDLPQEHRVILFTFDHRFCPIITNLTYI